MVSPLIFAPGIADALRYFTLRNSQPRRLLSTTGEPLHARVDRVAAAWESSRLSDGKGFARQASAILDRAYQASKRRIPSDALSDALLDLILHLGLENRIVTDFPDIDLSRSHTSSEIEHYVDLLSDLEARLEHDERVFGLFANHVVGMVAGMLDSLPPAAFDRSPAPFSVPLHAFVDAFDIAAGFQAAFFSRLPDSDHDPAVALAFGMTRKKLFENALRVSGLTPEQYERAPNRIVMPRDCEEKGDEILRRYLGGTPLYEFAQLQLPFRIPDTVRCEHFLMVARTGSGKTQFIQHDILHNLGRANGPGMVVIDSQNQMIPKLERLVAAKDRIVIIDPFDPSPPALNMFASSRPHESDRNLREVLEAKTLEQFAWIFSALDQELTGRQTTLFTFAARVLLSMQANMQTMLDLMRIEKLAELRSSPFWPVIEGADDQTRFFFEHRFCTNDYNRTKLGVADRLLGVLRVPAFNRMFMAPANKLDLYSLLERRKLVVFNTHKSRLGTDASAILGRYAISLYVRAALERERDLDKGVPPAFLYVDEASEYFGKKDSSDVLFTQLRKYNAGTFVAFQDLSQLGEQQHTLIANTSTKLTGGLTVGDARRLAPDMGTDEKDLLGVRKVDGSFEFMCHVGNMTPRAIRLSFPYGSVENAPTLSTEELAALRQRNRDLLSMPIRSENAAEPQTPLPAASPSREPVASVPPSSELKTGQTW